MEDGGTLSEHAIRGASPFKEPLSFVAVNFQRGLLRYCTAVTGMLHPLNAA